MKYRSIFGSMVLVPSSRTPALLRLLGRQAGSRAVLAASPGAAPAVVVARGRSKDGANLHRVCRPDYGQPDR